MLKLPLNLAELARLADPANPKFALGCLLVSERPDGYQVEVTDAKRLALVTGPGREADVPPLLADAPNGATEALVPAPEFAAVFRSGRRGRGPVPAVLAILGENVVTFLAGNSTTRVEVGTGRWPQIDSVIPTQEPAAEFVVSARLFGELLAAAAAFANGPDHNVRIRYWHPDKPVAVTAANGEGQAFFGLQMPVCGTVKVTPPPRPEPPPREPTPRESETRPRRRKSRAEERAAQAVPEEPAAPEAPEADPGRNGEPH
jgi:hypothetical protein